MLHIDKGDNVAHREGDIHIRRQGDTIVCHQGGHIDARVAYDVSDNERHGHVPCRHRGD